MTDRAGFALLCDTEGIVARAFGEGAIEAGTLLSTLVARDSRKRLLQILLDSRLAGQHSILQMESGTTVDVHTASDEGRILVVAGTDLAHVRRLCQDIDGDVAPLARRIMETSKPDELSTDLWGELARLNNDLATAHRQLAKSNAELRWMNEQKNQLLGMAAHDLRNPLAVVLAYAQFVANDDTRLSDDQKQMIRRIQANAETMLGMVEDVLDYSAVESGIVRLDAAEISVSELIADVANVNRVIAGRKDIRIASSIDPDLPPLFADRRKLGQVINNLLTNAIKFSHSGTSIAITAGLDPQDGIWIAVTDKGLGMSPEQLALLFQPFGRVGVQATAGEKSTGLGLAIVRRIVEAHNGRVEVESTQGNGTTFTIVLPVSRTESASV